MPRRLIPGNSDRGRKSTFGRFKIGGTGSADDVTMCAMRFGEEPALSALRHFSQLCINCRKSSVVLTIVRHSLG